MVSCPHCHSDDWKLASVVYQSGLSHVKTSTAAVGVGLGGGVGVGVGGSSTSGQFQTGMSASSAPPKEPKNGYGGMVAVIFFLMLISVSISDSAGAGVGWIIFILGTCFAIWMKSLERKPYENKVAEYKKDYTVWSKTRVCQRCGKSYRPPYGED